jgi:peptidoglycan/LPS O-acetylase OafA/YrhL
MPSRFSDRFRRITYSTAYLPQIDGLRFLAIFSVVVWMHSTHFLDEKMYGSRLITSSYWRNFIMEGGNGVGLFFIISGFILSLPFAKWRLRGERPVLLRNYFLRRVTRLEPPYIIALVILFIGQVWVVHKYEFSGLLPSFFASVFYVHGLVFHSFPKVLPVAWSLEVEVQFYILAPLFCCIFLIKKAFVRRALCLAIMAVSIYAWYDVWQIGHVFVYLHLFFGGILMADLHASGYSLFRHKGTVLVAGILCLLVYFFVPSIHSLPGTISKVAAMVLLVHLALSEGFVKNLFSIRVLVLIGGMCYSIYLLHFAIISATGTLLMNAGLLHPSTFLFLPLLFLLASIVLVLSSVYFLLVEKPFMRPMGMKPRP